MGRRVGRGNCWAQAPNGLMGITGLLQRKLHLSKQRRAAKAATGCAVSCRLRLLQHTGVSHLQGLPSSAAHLPNVTPRPSPSSSAKPSAGGGAWQISKHMALG